MTDSSSRIDTARLALISLLFGIVMSGIAVFILPAALKVVIDPAKPLSPLTQSLLQLAQQVEVNGMVVLPVIWLICFAALFVPLKLSKVSLGSKTFESIMSVLFGTFIFLMIIAMVVPLLGWQ